TIKILKNQTPEYKAELIAGVSNTVADIIVARFGADKEKVLSHLVCILEEVPYDSWGYRGVPVTQESVREYLGIE
ncbi:unnamed protein product, partial [marine sediment metagenome]